MLPKVISLYVTQYILLFWINFKISFTKADLKLFCLKSSGKASQTKYDTFTGIWRIEKVARS